jgi:hypothetical protein
MVGSMSELRRRDLILIGDNRFCYTVAFDISLFDNYEMEWNGKLL